MANPECRACVLIADDEPALRTMMAIVLEEMGLDVLMADNGQRCVELFRQHVEVISLAIIDATMPGMDGLACIRHLRRMQPDVRIILSSGYSCEEVAGDDVPDHFLRKPYKPETLQQAVASLL